MFVVVTSISLPKLAICCGSQFTIPVAIEINCCQLVPHLVCHKSIEYVYGKLTVATIYYTFDWKCKTFMTVFAHLRVRLTFRSKTVVECLQKTSVSKQNTDSISYLIKVLHALITHCQEHTNAILDKRNNSIIKFYKL